MTDLRLDDLMTETEALERQMAGTAGMTAAFTAALREAQGPLADTTRDLGNLERGFSGGLKRAIDGLVLDGLKLSDALSIVGRAMVTTAYNAAMKPVADHFGGLLAAGVNGVVSGLMPFAAGGAFAQGRVMPFASGGVVSGPVSFPMRGGRGLMGEAGPEAIMPLARGADGRLGVRTAGGGGPVQVTINIATPDVAGFQRSQGQIAADMQRLLARGSRNR
jgi:phage-related minor tail protein